MVLAIIPTLAATSQPFISPLPSPIPPEPYPNSDVYPALVYLTDQADLQMLYQLDIDLGGLRAQLMAIVMQPRSSLQSPLFTSILPNELRFQGLASTMY
jgi:hypothetical protein